MCECENCKAAYEMVSDLKSIIITLRGSGEPVTYDLLKHFDKLKGENWIHKAELRELRAENERLEAIIERYRCITERARKESKDE